MKADPGSSAAPPRSWRRVAYLVAAILAAVLLYGLLSSPAPPLPLGDWDIDDVSVREAPRVLPPPPRIGPERQLTPADVEGRISQGMKDIGFTRIVLSVEAGKVIEFELLNTGTLTHDFTIQSISANTWVVDGGRAENDEFDVHVVVIGKQKATLLMQVYEPGEYTFFCDVRGHRSAGMEGTLIVR
jgi:uncharacterized cupredoxin-like copper-binding protein